MKTKYCARCDGHRPLTDFGRNRQAVDGLHYYCRECAAARQREWAKAHPETVRKSKREYLQRMREQNADRDPYVTP